MYTWVVLLLLLLIPLYLLRPRRSNPAISELIVYPIKSCAGISLSKAEIVSTGLAYDRKWVFIDPSNHQVTAREDPRLWRIQPHLDLSGPKEPLTMTVTYEDRTFSIDLTKPMGRTITMQKSQTTAEVVEMSPETSIWIQETLGKDYRLCMVVNPQPSEISPDVPITVPDYGPILIASTASLREVQRELPEPKKSQIDMSCFRPNIVVEGCGTWEEDSWERVRIGGMEFRAAGPCDRCLMTTIDPKTLAFDAKTEPLPTLRRIHGKDIKGFFGQWFLRTQDGVLRLSDPIHVLQSKRFPN